MLVSGSQRAECSSWFSLHLRPEKFHPVVAFSTSKSHRLHRLRFCRSKEVVSHRPAGSNSIRHQDFKGCMHLNQRMQGEEDYKRRGRRTWGGPFHNIQSFRRFGYITVSLLTTLQRTFPKSSLFHCFFQAATQFAGAAPLCAFNLYLATGSQPTIRERHHKMPSRDVIIIAQMSAICLRW